MTNLVDGGPLRSISDGVKRHGTLLGRRRVFGLHALIKLDQLLGDRLAKQADERLPIILGNLGDFLVVFWLVQVGLRRLAGNQLLPREQR